MNFEQIRDKPNITFESEKHFFSFMLRKATAKEQIALRGKLREIYLNMNKKTAHGLIEFAEHYYNSRSGLYGKTLKSESYQEMKGVLTTAKRIIEKTLREKFPEHYKDV
ncbi:Uncharacterised protein [uncultured archaeon]|nr:Uncharacterised protein [uncultured archaeon]